jgi:hypothetical protein
MAGYDTIIIISQNEQAASVLNQMFLKHMQQSE